LKRSTALIGNKKDNGNELLRVVNAMNLWRVPSIIGYNQVAGQSRGNSTGLHGCFGKDIKFIAVAVAVFCFQSGGLAY
jgi:hypothetical protein